MVKVWGKAQLNGIEQYCRDNDYLKITLEVGDDNVAAKKLYSSFGLRRLQSSFDRAATLAKVPQLART